MTGSRGTGAAHTPGRPSHGIGARSPIVVDRDIAPPKNLNLVILVSLPIVIAGVQPVMAAFALPRFDGVISIVNPNGIKSVHGNDPVFRASLSLVRGRAQARAGDSLDRG